MIDESHFVYATDYGWNSAANSVGPVEVNSSNGGAGAGDGSKLTLNGNQCAKGLGVAGDSAVVYRTDLQFAKFICDVGVDDEARGR